MTRPVRSLAIVLLVCAAAPAFADAVKDAYDRAMAAFHAKDYAKSRSEFLVAHDLRPEPVFLFGVAQTYRYEGNYKQAIDYYRRYLQQSQLSADLRGEAEAHIARLETELQRIADEKRKAAAAGPKEPDGKPATIIEPPLNLPLPARAEPPPDRRIPLGSKIAAGVTGAALVGALVFTKLGLDAEQDLKNNPMATQADIDRVERYQNLINVSWGLTGAAAATAVILYFAAPSYATDRAVVVAPLRDGGWAASLKGRF